MPSELFVDVRAASTGGGAASRIVFVHGAMDRSTSFAKVRNRLGDHETVAYDRRGYARSLEAGPAVSFCATDTTRTGCGSRIAWIRKRGRCRTCW